MTPPDPDWPRLHDVTIRTRGSDPELACGLLVDGKQLLVPSGTRLRIEIADDTSTTVTLTLFAGSLRIEPETPGEPTS